jgi:hypothetical protein
MPALEGNEPGPSSSRDGILACSAPLCKQFSKALGTVGLLISRGELLAREHGLTVSARKALPVPGLILESDPSCGHNFLALCTLGCEFFLKAGHTIDVCIVGNDERLAPDRNLASRAVEALVMPFPVFVLHLFHPRSEEIATSVTAGSKLKVITVATENMRSLQRKRLGNERGVALVTNEAFLQTKGK